MIKIKRNSIFTKILALVLLSTLAISITSMIASSTISEKIIMEHVAKTLTVNVNNMKHDLLEFNDQIVNTMIRINTSTEFKRYLTQEVTRTAQQIKIVSDLGRYIDTYKDYLSPENSHFMVSGIGNNSNRNYSSNALKWDKIPPNLVTNYMMDEGIIVNQLKYHSSDSLFQESVPYDYYLFATKPLVEMKNDEIYGFAVVIIDEKNIYNLYNPYLSKGMKISLVTSEGRVLSSSTREQTSQFNVPVIQLVKDQTEANKVSIQNLADKMTYISTYIPEYDAYLIMEIDQRVAFASLYDIAENIAKIVAVILLLVLCIVYMVSRKITKPLYELVHTMQNTKLDAMRTHPLQGEGSYEMKILTKTYNSLIKELTRNTEKLLIEEKERRKADLNALQMQINPHFLYNTLTSIKYLAKMNRIDDVEKTIVSLSSMLEQTIGKTEDKVTVEAEIEALKHYVHINQIRYGDQIKIHFDIAEECHQLFIPKLIVQPFIENAFFHAFPGDQRGNIHVFIRLKEHGLVIEIIDDGVGNAQGSEMKKNGKRSLSGIGINNVHHRIQLLYGSEYGVRLDSELGYGTAVTITLPKILTITVEE